MRFFTGCSVLTDVGALQFFLCSINERSSHHNLAKHYLQTKRDDSYILD